jgi:hypothetical protein
MSNKKNFNRQDAKNAKFFKLKTAFLGDLGVLAVQNHIQRV